MRPPTPQPLLSLFFCLHEAVMVFFEYLNGYGTQALHSFLVSQTVIKEAWCFHCGTLGPFYHPGGIPADRVSSREDPESDLLAIRERLGDPF